MPARSANRGAFALLSLLLFIGVQSFDTGETKKEQDMTTVTATTSADETAIRALEDRFTAAFNAGDIDAMMKNYIPEIGRAHV